MRILLTGAAGFIGFHVAQRLLADGHTVLGVDDLTPYYDVRLKEQRLALLRGGCAGAHDADNSKPKHRCPAHEIACKYHEQSSSGQVSPQLTCVLGFGWSHLLPSQGEFLLSFSQSAFASLAPCLSASRSAGVKGGTGGGH